ncbi:unnamed protein product [Darwinula stevensoni]|uniref:C-type lectin domain-containing protein n=1 Tax=Darwinula stevensoni TaxID=69355 RepID=A0A7R9ACT0_9CRUS|nr:unnamed protein product [Darwinula stevensoni]CAG0900655.1 unnamed protein product [Darwinula stevensoni]
MDAREKTFVLAEGVNATIVGPLVSVPGWDAVACADSCVRNANCSVFSMETGPGATVCQLGSDASTFLANPAGMSAALYYDRNLVPPGYEFATITTEMHFLKPVSGMQDYQTGLAACQTDGSTTHLVQDDKGLDWHDFILQYAASKLGASTVFWLGGDDLDGDLVYKWNDGTAVSASVQDFWYTGQPSYGYGETLEQCMVIHWESEGVVDEWNDGVCSELKGVICEKRLP